MYWEMVILAIAWIVLIFDIVWQFLIAGIYAPKKAKRLIVESEEFQRLEQKLVTLEGKFSDPVIFDQKNDLSALKKELTGLEGKIDAIIDRPDIVTVMSEKIENLKHSINGKIGKEMREFYDNAEIDQAAGLDKIPVDPDSPLFQVEIEKVERQVECDMAFGLLQAVMDDEKAAFWAEKYANAPKFLKKSLKKKFNQWTGGMIGGEEKELES